MDVHTITPNFPELYGMRLLAGRQLSDNRVVRMCVTDIERLRKPRTQYPDQRNCGQALRLHAAGSDRKAVDSRAGISSQVVGVLADAKIDGARQAVRAAVFIYNKPDTPFISVLLRPNTVPDTLAFIDRTWQRFAPTTVITRHFISDDFARLYHADEKQGTLLAIFVGLAIFIACMGLFGLAAFTAGRRTKEIGIRKVFGARDKDVLLLLLWQFSTPVVIANAIAWPVAWYYLHGWLQGFAYRITLSPAYFVGAGAIALAIAWATVFVHALRVARANPIRALRYE